MVNEAVRTKIITKITRILERGEEKLSNAYTANPGKLNLDLHIKISPPKTGDVPHVKVSMSAVTDRFKDTEEDDVPKQMTIDGALEEKAKENPLHAKAEEHTGGPTGKVRKIRESTTGV